MTNNILESLINASERAANIARSCCSGTCGKTLLVTEKCEDANSRFERDFKTIADVLAQECARTEISSRCPELAKYVRGEECSEIGGITIGMLETAENTAKLLEKLVPSSVAKQMAEAAHSDIKLSLNQVPILPEIDINDLGVWIDPIDATAEFIAGVRGEADADQGLPCVTVLIGAYLRSTGEAVMGVINQPFFNNGKGRIIWGISYGNTKKWSGVAIDTDDAGKNTILMSAAEKPHVVEKFKNAGWEVKSVPGAGHKLLKVALGEAAAYIVSKRTTFRWDTCAPHAILCAKGGGLLCYKTFQPITYNDPQHADTQMYSNSDGIIAYGNTDILNKIKTTLK